MEKNVIMFLSLEVLVFLFNITYKVIRINTNILKPTTASTTGIKFKI